MPEPHANASSSFDASAPSRTLPPPSSYGESQGDLVEQAKTWIRSNQTPAMAGAFALGVFIGAMMRR